MLTVYSVMRTCNTYITFELHMSSTSLFMEQTQLAGVSTGPDLR